MRLRNVPGAKETVAASPYCETAPSARRGHWREFFGTTEDTSGESRGAGEDETLLRSPAEGERPLYLEIGCGKGRFLAEAAAADPGSCFLGIEKYTSVLVRAVKKQEALQLANLRFARMEAECLPEVFAPGEVSRIYLNFSDPWPKERHAQRRLPSSAFLHRYEEVLAPGGRVIFKTDNEALFDFALSELSTAGWEAETVSRDLHADEALVRGNIMTEYETRFVAMGKPIFYMVISRGKGG